MADSAVLTTPHKPVLGQDQIDFLSARWQEPPELLARRQEFQAAYARLGMPDRVQHLWRYTDPGKMLPMQPWLEESTVSTMSAVDVAQSGPRILVQPGRAPVLNQAAEAAGLVLEPLGGAGKDLARLGQGVTTEHGLLEALNGAAWNAGLYLRVPRGRILEEPVRVVLPAVATTSLPRLLVVVDEGAVATVVEEHVGGSASTQVVGVSELFLAQSAQLNYVILQEWEAGVVGHLTNRAQLETQAHLFTALASFGGATAKLDWGASLAGEGAQSEMVGVALGEGRQHLDHHTVHKHLAPHTWSNLNFKVALTGRARSVYTGLIRIEDTAPYSEAYQENRNLLLSEKCRADTIPELEIMTDEVSCSHGATAAPIDEEQMFYLESRGIPEEEAVRLIVRGFLEDILRRLPHGLHDGLEGLITERLTRISGGHR